MDQFKPTDTDTPETLATKAAAIIREISKLNHLLYEVGMARPPITYSELVKGSNFLDKSFEAEVRRWMADYMESINLSDWGSDGDGPEYSEDWELSPECRRYQVIGCWLTETETEEIHEGWIIWDRDEQEIVTSQSGAEEMPPGTVDPYNVGPRPAPKEEWYYSDESAAEADASDLENEDGTAQNLNGFPFAQSIGHKPDRSISDQQLADAGFIVWTYKGERIAGIDGGGYSMTDSHHAPLYWAWLTAPRDYDHTPTVQTDTGPRRVSK